MTFLTMAEDDPYQPLWTLALYTGMRRGELLGLRWQDVDLDLGVLHVRLQVTDFTGPDRVQTPKTESGRRAIDLPPLVVEALRGHRVRQLQRRLASIRWQESGLICTSAVGTAIGPRNATRRFQELRERAELPDLTLHGLRHTAATLMLTAGMPMHDVSAILGHSNPTTTAQIYAQTLREQRRKATLALAEALESGRKAAM
jgi:integrase